MTTVTVTPSFWLKVLCVLSFGMFLIPIHNDFMGEANVIIGGITLTLSIFLVILAPRHLKTVDWVLFGLVMIFFVTQMIKQQ